MKLKDILPPTIKKKRNKTFESSLIINLQKIKYDELDSINNFLDNKINLSNVIKGFYPIHYAALNSDYRVLEYLITLYNKHDLNLNILTSTYKNSIPQGSNIMDIAYIKQSSFHFLLLHKYDLQPVFLKESGFMLLQRNLAIDDSDYKVLSSIFSRIPYPNNVITPIIYCSHDFAKMINFFTHQNYDEKERYLEEFKENLYFLKEEYLKNHINISDLTYKLTNTASQLNSDSFPEIYFISFFSTINYVYNAIHPKIFFDGENIFEEPVPEFKELSKLFNYNSKEMLLQLFSNNDKVSFFQKYPDILQQFNDSYEKFIIILSKLPESNGILDYNDFFIKTNQLILHNKLTVSLPENNIFMKKNKL